MFYVCICFNIYKFNVNVNEVIIVGKNYVFMNGVLDFLIKQRLERSYVINNVVIIDFGVIFLRNFSFSRKQYLENRILGIRSVYFR